MGLFHLHESIYLMHSFFFQRLKKTISAFPVPSAHLSMELGWAEAQVEHAAIPSGAQEQRRWAALASLLQRGSLGSKQGVGAAHWFCCPSALQQAPRPQLGLTKATALLCKASAPPAVPYTHYTARGMADVRPCSFSTSGGARAPAQPHGTSAGASR